MTLNEEYFNLQDKYEKEYGEKTIVFLEKGMFYEIYGIDNSKEKRGQAYIVSQLLNIQLTKANKKIETNDINNPLMTGFPVLSLKKNIKILLENGYTIVTFDQEKKCTSQRKVSNIYSPSTYIEEHISSNSNYLCSMYLELNDGIYSCGLSFIDLSTGHTCIYENITKDRTLFFEDINRVIERYNANEYTVITINIDKNFIKKEINANNKLIHFNNNYTLEITKSNYQNEVLNKIYKYDNLVSLIEEFDLEKMIIGTASFINILQFCYEHNESILNNIQTPVIIQDEAKCILHNNALYQLNICSNQRKEKGITCLFDVVNNTSTPMGRRLLREKILNPITNIENIQDNYDKIEIMIPNINWYENELKNILDIERYHRKLCIQKISLFELSNLQTSYNHINVILNQKYKSHNVTKEFEEYYKYYLETYKLCIMRTCNLNDLQENIFNDNIFPEIDLIQKNINQLVNNFEKEGKYLSNLLNQKENIIKFEYSSKGYLFYSTLNRCEQLGKIVKDLYSFRKESKTKCCISSNKINKWIDELSKNQNALQPLIESFYFKTLEHITLKYKNMFLELNKIIANLDVIKSQAKTAIEHNYCKPYVYESDDGNIEAKEMRHAIIECLDHDCDYIPNDVSLNDVNHGILLYGVNGSGKSCYSKSIGLCIVLAQSGHYVPCTKFSYSPFTKLYTRITGDDNIFRGHSSFFVEMSELKSIINYADSKSIVIGDEVCKGTEDISAVSIVGTTIKHLLNNKTKFIFATHLHKLPNISILKDEKRLSINHIEIEFDETTIFTRKLKNGIGDLLYGLEIAHSILKNEQFHSDAFHLRNELLNKSSKIIADKKSKYNGNVYVNHCLICGKTDNLETHHIIFQSQSTIKKHRKSNLVVLCTEDHDRIHNGKITVIGWIKTTEGKMLKYINNEKEFE